MKKLFFFGLVLLLAGTLLLVCGVENVGGVVPDYQENTEGTPEDEIELIIYFSGQEEFREKKKKFMS